MRPPETRFEIVECNDCPMYAMGEQFKVVENALTVRGNHRPVCVLLVQDIVNVLAACSGLDAGIGFVFPCRGCSGMVSLELSIEEQNQPGGPTEAQSQQLEEMVETVRQFDIVRELDDDDVRDVAACVRTHAYTRGAVILQKGEVGQKLFMVLEGEVEIIGEQGIRIAVLGDGEVFGDMSLISGGPVTATVRVLEPLRVLVINGGDFRELAGRYPSFQTYFARLLAKRLAQTNLAMSRELGAGMTGNIRELPPSELFQTLHLNRKTGILTLSLSEGSARLVFNGGALVRAEYGELTDREAFFHLLRENEGRFRFTPALPEAQRDTPPIAEFMWLLTEGIRLYDEEIGRRKGMDVPGNP